jgi:hypothetical protein
VVRCASTHQRSADFPDLNPRNCCDRCCLFASTSGRTFYGEQILPTGSPLPFFAYPFLVMTFVGWIVALLKADGSNAERSIGASIGVR